MGVNIYILDRRPARLAIGGVGHSVGTLRRFWKITELDDERATELTASERPAQAVASPPAAMLADVFDMPLRRSDGPIVKAHLVIGWDEGRTRVTDMGWDYLPVLGYGVRDPDRAEFVLHEERSGALHPLGREQAMARGLIDADGKLIRHGQPVITECRSVRPYIAGYAEADCTFDSGAEDKLLIATTPDALPPEEWLVGKRPMDVERYQRNLAGPPAP